MNIKSVCNLTYINYQNTTTLKNVFGYNIYYVVTIVFLGQQLYRSHACICWVWLG